MKRMTYFVMALALVLGLAQCKKEQMPANNENEGVRITLNVNGGNNGSKVIVDPNAPQGYATVTFESGDIIYVGNNGAYVGYLTYDGTNFSGSIDDSNLNEADYLHFYFMGNKGTTSQPTEAVSITDQTSKYPVISYAHSKTLYNSEVSTYTAKLQNYCAIVKFTTNNIPVETDITVKGMQNTVSVNFGANNAAAATPTLGVNPYTPGNSGTGDIILHAVSPTERWAILLEQDAVNGATVTASGYSNSTCNVPGIANNTYHPNGVQVSLTPAWDGDLSKLTNESTEAFATAADGMTITGTLGVDKKISIADGATVTLDGVTINGTNNNSYNWAGINCLGDATIILKDGTTNTVKGFYDFHPGIYVPEGKTLTIKGTGTLNASSNGKACGIGGGLSISCGNIEIQGGTITATGGNGSAGIGSGNGFFGNVNCGTITISGGNVTATGGSSAAGIGSGNGENNSSYARCGDITISGGIVEATGGQYAAGIGSGYGSKASCGTITITDTDGVTSVTATKGSNATNSIGAGILGTCGTVTFDNVVMYNGSSWTTTPTNGGTYGGLSLAITTTTNTNDTWTLTPYVAPSVPEGAINGLFSVSSTKQVYFSQGNLQATTTDKGSTWIWSFATNQYDYVGDAVANTAINGNGTVSTNGTVDLFGWSTAATVYGIHNSESDDYYSGDFVDWGNNAIANGGNTANSGWRTLTNDEWVYLFDTRTDAASKKGLGKVNSVNGIILLPDEWTLPSGLTFTPFTPNSSWANDYTTEQWAQMEAGGAVFLPAAGNRQSTNLYLVGDRGYYWSSTANDPTTSYIMFFANRVVMLQISTDRYLGQCVRLVHDNN